MTPQDHVLADRLLADAFSGNQITPLLVGENDVLHRLALMNRRYVRLKQGKGLIAEVDGQPAGALLFADSPHCEPGGFAGIGALVDAIRSMRLRLFRTFDLFKESARNHPEWPHRHLSLLGVATDFQSNGVGSVLMREFCQLADEAEKQCYLETDSEGGKRLYERFGFKEVHRQMHGTIPFIFMWRNYDVGKTG